jgi:hypothetical protein
MSSARNGVLNFAADTAGWCLPKGGGGATIGGRWCTEHALERMARTAEVMAEPEARFNRRVAAQGGQAQRSREVQDVL